MNHELLSKPSEFDAAEGRDVAAILDPCPVTIIGARDNTGHVGFATVIWAMPVSHNPGMTAFALRAKSHTMGIIRATGLFSLSTLPSDAESVRIVNVCGCNSGHKVNKGELVEHELIECHPSENESNECKLGDSDSVARELSECEQACQNNSNYPESRMLPIPTHALSWQLCEVESVQEAGDHLLVVGRVLKAASRASRDAKGRLAPTETLLCIQHDAYAPVGETI